MIVVRKVTKFTGKLFKAQQAALEKKIDRLRDAYLAGADTVEEYRAAKEATQAQLAQVTQQIEDYSEKTAAMGTPEAMRSAIETALKTLVSDSSTMEQKYEAIHSVVGRAVFDKANNRLDIFYRLIF